MAPGRKAQSFFYFFALYLIIFIFYPKYASIQTNARYNPSPKPAKAKEKKIPVVVDTQCLEGATLMHVYDVGKKAMEAGAIQAFDMSFESSVTKLMWALKRAPYEEIEKIMHTNYTGEINTEGVIY